MTSKKQALSSCFCRLRTLGLVGVVLLTLLAFPKIVLAHPGEPPEPHDLWSAWNLEPTLLSSLAFVALIYGLGIGALWKRAGPGRCIQRWRVMAFAGGWLALHVALVSPLDASGKALFSAHMVQHLVLILIAAPLLVSGSPLIAFLWALPTRKSRHTVGRWWRNAGSARAAWAALSQPLLVWFLYAFFLWIWHLPSLYQAALDSQWIHDIEHLSFLGTALLFWWTLIQPAGPRRLSYGAGILFVFTTALHSSVLGALITFAQTILYPAYVSTVPAWGLTPLEDQQLAGLIMWIPPGVLYLLIALTLFALWLHAVEARVKRRENRLAALS